MRDVTRIQPQAGTELFSSIDPLPGRGGDKWQLGFGPIDSSPAAWVLYRRRGTRVVARKALRASFPGRLRLQLWLSTTIGPRHAAAFLRVIGPLEGFYQRYADAWPVSTPLDALEWPSRLRFGSSNEAAAVQDRGVPA